MKTSFPLPEFQTWNEAEKKRQKGEKIGDKERDPPTVGIKIINFTSEDTTNTALFPCDYLDTSELTVCFFVLTAQKRL